jgi:hypothetical protein
LFWIIAATLRIWMTFSAVVFASPINRSANQYAHSISMGSSGICPFNYMITLVVITQHPNLPDRRILSIAVQSTIRYIRSANNRTAL